MEQDFENQRPQEGALLEGLRASISQLADEVRALREEKQRMWFTREEAAEYLGYSARTIDRCARLFWTVLGYRIFRIEKVAAGAA